VFAVSLGAIFLLSRPVIEARLDTTQLQVQDMRRRGDFGGRQLLYADTWHMACDKLWFGWGLGSYATVFDIYNSQHAIEPWYGQRFYTQAHSDWLQSVAEVGLTGTGLLVLMGLLPLASAFRHRSPFTELPRMLLFGCGLIGLYAWLEFPFANPAVMLVFWLCLFVAVRYVLLDDKTTVSDSSCSRTALSPF
jgi:O-antigen ligase